MNPSVINWKSFRQTALIGAVALAFGVACEPLPESERRYFESRDFDADHQQAMMQTDFEWNSVDGAIELVKITEAPEAEEGTIDEWIRGIRAAIDGDVMFPRWEGRRLGSHRFEVRYTHTVVDSDYTIERFGYAWEVDAVLKTVDGPTALDPAELEPRPRRAVLREPIPELLDEGFDPE